MGKGGVAKKASEIWKAMSEVDKAPFQTKFNEQLAAFREYQQSDSYVKPERQAKRNRGEKKSKKQKDPNAPKKLCGGAYGIFASEVRARITADNPGKAVSVVAKAIKAEYDALSADQKKGYQAQYEEKKAAYQVAFQEYCEKKKLEPTAEEGSEDGEDAEESEDGEDAEEKEDDVDAVVLSEATPQKKRKVETSPQKKEKAAPAPAPAPAQQKKEKASKASFNNTDPLLAEAKKEGLDLKLKTMMEKPEFARKGSQVLLDALRKAGGKVAEAKADLKRRMYI